MRPSMEAVGECDDNALCKSVFAPLERELRDRCRFRTLGEARMKVYQSTEVW